MNIYSYKMNKFSVITDEQKESLGRYNFSLIDQKNIDGYDLALTHSKSVYFPEIDPDGAYQLAIQRGDLDFTSREQQMSKYKSDGVKDRVDFFKNLKLAITEWIDRYGVIFVGSFNDKKTETYRKILERLGFSTKSVRWGGHIVYYIGEKK